MSSTRAQEIGCSYLLSSGQTFRFHIHIPMPTAAYTSVMNLRHCVNKVIALDMDYHGTILFFSSVHKVFVL